MNNIPLIYAALIGAGLAVFAYFLLGRRAFAGLGVMLVLILLYYYGTFMMDHHGMLASESRSQREVLQEIRQLRESEGIEREACHHYRDRDEHSQCVDEVEGRYWDDIAALEKEYDQVSARGGFGYYQPVSLTLVLQFVFMTFTAVIVLGLFNRFL